MAARFEVVDGAGKVLFTEYDYGNAAECALAHRECGGGDAYVKAVCDCGTTDEVVFAVGKCEACYETEGS